MKAKWKSRWIKERMLGSGGQGHTYFATPTRGGCEKLYVIKFLKAQKNTERRERMFVEVAALRTLKHPNIPKLIDHNADCYNDINVEMYLVSEYIKGQTLQEFIDIKSLDLNDSLILCISLANTIEFCHQKGFVHRDIKPDNIILKNDNIYEPILIDFGLSFNNEIFSQKEDTPSWQHIGNRFLSLPELRVSDSNKRDPRSDVTMLCGILLFCLTGIHPTDLLDANNTKPHRRKKSNDKLSDIAKTRLSSLNKILDIGFNTGINDRWQTIQSLKHELAELKHIQEENKRSMSIQSRLDKFKERIEGRIDYQQLQNLENIVNGFDKTIEDALFSSRQRLASEQFNTTIFGEEHIYTSNTFKRKVGISHKFNQRLSFTPIFVLYLNGSELVIEAIEESARTELIRYPINEVINWDKLHFKVEDYLIEGIMEKEE